MEELELSSAFDIANSYGERTGVMQHIVLRMAFNVSYETASVYRALTHMIADAEIKLWFL